MGLLEAAGEISSSRPPASCSSCAWWRPPAVLTYTYRLELEAGELEGELLEICAGELLELRLVAEGPPLTSERGPVWVCRCTVGPLGRGETYTLLIQGPHGLEQHGMNADHTPRRRPEGTMDDQEISPPLGIFGRCLPRSV